MTEKSYFWDGKVVGDHGAYSHENFARVLKKLLTDDKSQGVLHNQELELSVIAGYGSVILSTGWALVDGKLYHNSSNVTFYLSTPASGNNYYRVIIKKDNILKTVRSDILGPETITYPSVSGSSGDGIEVKLYGVSISSSGLITLVDERSFCVYSDEQLSSEIFWDDVVLGSMHTGGDTSDGVSVTPGSDLSLLSERQKSSSGAEWQDILGEGDFMLRVYVESPEPTIFHMFTGVANTGFLNSELDYEIPVGYDGFYMVGMFAEWDEWVGIVTPTLKRSIMILLNDEIVAMKGIDTPGISSPYVESVTTYQTVSVALFLSGGDVIKFAAQHNNLLPAVGGHLAVDNSYSWILRIR